MFGSGKNGEKHLRVADLGAEVSSKLKVFTFFGKSNLEINLAGDKGWAQHFLSHGHALHMLIMKVLSLQQITGYKIMYSQGKEKVPHMCTK